MSGQPPSKPPARMPGSIDFEITDFDEARHALDDLPAGVAEAKQLLSGSWEQQRRKPVATDRALTGQAMDWVIGLPPTLRPHATCEQFPRVINAIASSWTDTAYSLQVLDHMINDYRGGRRGFPATVELELTALQAHQRARSGG
jgi:hypothetical protein